MNCKSCGAPLKKEGAKFCSKCGARQPEATDCKETVAAGNGGADDNAGKGMSVVKQRLYWQVNPGEIACRINEAEFVNYDSLLGIIINDGTTAYIRSNGQLITVVHGGCYDFIAPKELDSLLETRVGGLNAGMKKAFKALANLIMGRRVKEQVEEKDDKLSKLKSLDDAVRHLQKNELYSITLKQDREFQLVFGESHQDLDGYSDFAPMEVRTKWHDVSVGMRAFFQVSDFNEFAAFYLGEHATVRTSLLAKMLTPLVRATVQDCLKDVELSDAMIPEEARTRIEARLKAADFHGIVLKSIVEVTADNEALQRMRALAKELYLSEQELSHLQRTNDFKNRLNTVVAQQQIAEARSEQELYLRLQEINKDKLLNDEELRKFYVVLSREGRIFDAQSNLAEAEANEKIAKAFADMEKTGLLRQEELDLLKFQIQEREYQRGYAVKLMQLKDAIEYEKVRTGGEQEIQLQALAAELELVRTKDHYQDERFYKELEQWNARKNAELGFMQQQADLQNRQAEFAFNLSERAQQSQMERYMQMERLDDEMQEHEAERRRKEMQLQQEHQLKMQQEKEQTIRQRESMHREMTAEQIAAQRLSEISDAAQVEYFKAQAAGKNADEERRLREEQAEFLKQQNAAMMAANERNMDRMQDMMGRMMDSMATVSGNMVQNRNEQKEEYRNELHRQQARHDLHQDQALNYTTRYPQTSTIIVPAGDKKAPVQPGDAQPQQTKGMAGTVAEDAGAGWKECPECHRKYPAGDNFCAECGCFI